MDLKNIVAGVISALATTLILWMLGLLKNVTEVIMVPSAAIMAFDLHECPNGWRAIDAAEGKFIVGSGRSDRSTFKVGTSGGRETVTLGTANMPPHSHKVTTYRWYLFNTGSKTAWTDDPQFGDKKDVETSTEGFGNPFEIMPPWISYKICRKI